MSWRYTRRVVRLMLTTVISEFKESEDLQMDSSQEGYHRIGKDSHFLFDIFMVLASYVSNCYILELVQLSIV